MPSRRLLLSALLPIALLLTSRGAREKALNILLISMDTTRADHLSAYGYPFATSPYLEEFAAEGAIFRQNFAPAPATSPAHATMFTSLVLLTHRVLKNAMVLGEQYETLAEVLGGHGYQTAAVLSSFVLNRKFGLSQGFAFYDDDLSKTKSTVPTKSWQGEAVLGKFDCQADATTDRALAWLEQQREAGKPFFFFVHYFDPHAPYYPPQEYRRTFTNPAIPDGRQRFEIGSYDGEIAFTDAQIRRLLERLAELGLAEDTIVVVTGDHGEGLWDHGYQYHGAQIYDEAVRVLLVRWPGRIPAGVDVAAPVTLADVMPTLLELAGVGTDGLTLQGRSLVPTLIAGHPLPADEPVFLYRIPFEPHDEFGTWVDGEKFGVRRGAWKYIVGEAEGTSELFDLASDPDETANLAEAEPARVADLAALLDRWRTAVSVPDSLSIRPELSDSDRQKLKSLGYVH